MPCPGCGSLNHLHFWVRVGTELPARLTPCPNDAASRRRRWTHGVRQHNRGEETVIVLLWILLWIVLASIITPLLGAALALRDQRR